MKGRPRRVENRVADWLNIAYGQLNVSPVERIPVLGREGPDISVNELGLAVDVKSRIKVPKLYRIRGSAIFEGAEDYFGTRLGELDFLRVYKPKRITKSSSVVEAWLEHMREWSEECVGALVLHWPRAYVSSAIFLVRKEEWDVIHERACSIQKLSA